MCAFRRTQHRPPAAELVQFTRRFLGLFMINRFDILMFLEDAGRARACFILTTDRLSLHWDVASINCHGLQSCIQKALLGHDVSFLGMHRPVDGARQQSEALVRHG